MKQLWNDTSYGTNLDPDVAAFTTDEDPALDLILLPYDIVGTMAHLDSLQDAQIITPEEYRLLAQELLVIKDDCMAGNITDLDGAEDCHTYIEARLTESLGSLGQKIHAGRSRNDQVLTAMRLYEREALGYVSSAIDTLTTSIAKTASQWTIHPMPGFSHGRQGMVVDAGLWIESYGELLDEDRRFVDFVGVYLDKSPLGSGAGFGNGLGLNRGVSARAMGFGVVQQNSLSCMGSRGKDELLCLDALKQVALTAAKFANDMMLFTSEQFGWFSLPDSMLTGSSMMPNKRNYDLLELIRANASVISGHAAQVAALLQPLGSGYHRDFQFAKKPLFDGFSRSLATLKILQLVIDGLDIHPEKIATSISEGASDTDKVLAKVLSGVPFREAYHAVKSGENGAAVSAN